MKPLCTKLLHTGNVCHSVTMCDCCILTCLCFLPSALKRRMFTVQACIGASHVSQTCLSQAAAELVLDRDAEGRIRQMVPGHGASMTGFGGKCSEVLWKGAAA